MNYRKLGNTGLDVSTVGFGAWGIGGNHGDSVSYGPMDDKDSLKALDAAFDEGINFYDTSNVYGFGHSEKLLGQAFKDKRDKVILATKAGMIDNKGTLDFSIQNLRSSLEESLKNLQTDYVDMFQLHAPHLKDFENSEEVLELLDVLKTEGKIRATGITVKTPEDAITSIKDFGFRSVMVNFNLLDVRALDVGVLDCAKEYEAGLIARTPLCFGFLTGLFDGGTDFEKTDHRSNWSPEQRDAWKKGHDLFKAELMDQFETQTSSQFALRFCLSFPQMSAAIPGMVKESEVRENAKAGGMDPLDDEIMQKVISITSNNDFFVSRGKHWLHKNDDKQSAEK